MHPKHNKNVRMSKILRVFGGSCTIRRSSSGRVNSIIVAVLLGLVQPSLAGFTVFDQFGAGASRGVAWGDYDGDGDLDLAVSNSDAQNKLYRNDGGGIFVELDRFGRGYRGLVWADFDNDGDLDLAVYNITVGTVLFRNDGGDNFTGADTVGKTARTLSLACGDYDNDGDLDLALGNRGQNMLIRNEGDGSFTELSDFWTGETSSLAWGDYDSDGDLDIAVANADMQQSMLYKNDGAGNFAGLDRFGTGNSRGLAWGDYDGDGDLDIAVINYDQQNMLYRNEGGDVFTELARFGMGVGFGCAWGDYDNDGDLDFAVSSLTNINRIHVNRGTDFIPPGVIPLHGDDESYGLAWGDYDNDGDLDVAVANRGQNKLYRNDENDIDYIKVRLEGLGPPGYSNKSGIGARVKVYDAGTTNLKGFREISAGSGYCSMNSLGAEFGVPAGDTFDVEIFWPVSGVTCVVEDVAPPAVLNVREDCVVTGIDEGPAKHQDTCLTWKLKQSLPNPFHFRTIIEYQIPAGSRVTLKVYDSSGRLVCILVDEERAAGQHTATWDGKSGAARPVSSGIYFYRLQAGDFTDTKKMTLLR